jgi:hypothetical protein
MTLLEIQEAIESLSKDEQTKLATWVAHRDVAAWDGELEGDFAASGVGGEILENVRQQVGAGKSKPFTSGRSL